MGHHHHGHDHHHHHGESNIATAFFLNLSFTLIEIIGGLLTNSIAILSDALHDLGDSLSLGIAWYFQKLSKKGSDRHYTFGYKRFNTLGAFINGIVLVFGSVLILYEAIPRLWHPEQPEISGMIGLAILGILVNGAAVLKMKSGNSLNERVITLHLLEDVLGWAAVLIGSIIMYFYDLPIIDPILSIGITLYVLFNVFKSLKAASKIMLQATPEGLELDAIKTAIEKIAGVKDLHHPHIWSLDGIYSVLTLHIKTGAQLTVAELKPIKSAIRQTLKPLNINHVTIEFEAETEDCEHPVC